MVTQRTTPVIPPARPSEPQTLIERYCLDLAQLSTPLLASEECAARLRVLSGRRSPGDLVRLAACQARLGREEGGR